MTSAKHAIRRASASLLTTIVAVVLAACGPEFVGFTFDNRSTATLCDYMYPEEIVSALCLTEIAPHSKKKSGRDCDADASRPIRVIIVTKRERRIIYDRTASCGEWDKSKRRFVIEQVGDDFVVTDSLSASSP